MAKLSTQQFLEIDQIKEGTIILKNGALRGVLMVSSQNFALKSEDEQNATIYQFQNFLNSLDFSVQVFIQSRKINITGYLEKLKELEEKQENELLKIQTKEYQEFIKSLVEVGSIMTKTFYAIIPFVPFELAKVETYKKLLAKPEARKPLTEEEFYRYRTQLWQRMEFVALGLKRCGLRAVPLTTRELVELFWGVHHPEESEVGYFPEVPPELGI
jgi:type IV secretory pathway VirB4 component